MSASSFIKSTKGRVILGTVAALHFAVYFAKPSIFRSETDSVKASPPKYLPGN